MAILGFKLVDQLQNSLLLHYIEINCVFLDLGVYFYLYLGEGAFLIAQLVKCLQCRRTWFDSWVRKIHWRKDRLPTPVLLGFPCGSAGKESACSEGDLGSIPGLGRSPGGRKGYPLQYSGLEKSMDCIVHGVPKSQTQLSNFHSLLLFILIKIMQQHQWSPFFLSL